MAEPVLQVAHAAVAADVDPQSRTPTHLVVGAGEPFAVRFSYQVHDAPRVTEAWRFRLTVRLDDGREMLSEARFDDATTVDEEDARARRGRW